MHRSHKCTECSLEFTRPSHLARHTASHRPRNERDHLLCPECNRTFFRNDVLLRHLRSVHGQSPLPKSNMRLSCYRCVLKKLKCDRSRPCSSCKQSRTTCQYDKGKPQSPGRKSPVSPSSINSMAVDRMNELAGSTEVSQNESPSASFTEPSDTQQKVLQHEEIPVGNLCQFDTNSCDLPSETSVFPDLTQTGISSGGSPRSTFFPGVMFQENPAFGGFMSGLTNITGMGSSSLDWLDIQLLDSPVNPGIALVDNPLDSVPTSCSPDCSGQDPRGGALPCLPSSNDAAFSHSQISEQPVARTHTAGPAPQQWPFDQSRDQVPCTYQLPPLREVLQTNLRADQDGPKDISQCLINLFLKPRIPDLDETLQDCTILPAVHLVHRSIVCFFSDFDSILPMIHRPSWSLSCCPTVLIASMACMGAMFLNDENAMDRSRTLSKISARMIFWLVSLPPRPHVAIRTKPYNYMPQGDSDSNKYHDITYLIACCLHQIYSLGSGSWQMYQDADRSRGVLVGSLRGMGLLQSRISVETTKPDSQLSIGADLADVQKEWSQWIVQEQEKRVTWSCFEYDCSLCTLTGRRGAVDLSELPSRLPCADALWDAPTALAWRALGSHSPPTLFGASVDVVLRNVLAGRPIPSDISLSSWAKRLCGQIIGRLLWDLKQLDTLSLSGWLGLPHLRSVQNQAKMSLLQSFDNLALSINCPLSTKELIDYKYAFSQIFIVYGLN